MKKVTKMLLVYFSFFPFCICHHFLVQVGPLSTPKMPVILRIDYIEWFIQFNAGSSVTEPLPHPKEPQVGREKVQGKTNTLYISVQAYCISLKIIRKEKEARV